MNSSNYINKVCKGVFKRLLSLWTGTWHKKKGRKHKLGALDLNRIDARLSKIRKSYPKEFHRIFKSIYKVRQMKAVELRALLLYFGPYEFKGMINMFILNLKLITLI